MEAQLDIRTNRPKTDRGRVEGRQGFVLRKQQLELDMKPQTGSNRKRSTSRLNIVILLI